MNNLLLHLPYIGIFCCTYPGVKSLLHSPFFLVALTLSILILISSFFFLSADDRRRHLIGNWHQLLIDNALPCVTRNHNRRVGGVIYRKRYASRRVGWSLCQIPMPGAMQWSGKSDPHFLNCSCSKWIDSAICC